MRMQLRAGASAMHVATVRASRRELRMLPLGLLAFGAVSRSVAPAASLPVTGGSAATVIIDNTQPRRDQQGNILSECRGPRSIEV